MTTNVSPFHLAFPVSNLAASRHFYGDVLGCEEGRSSDQWIDFNFFGHQIVAHLDDSHLSPNSGSNEPGDETSNAVDGHDVPVPHFGVVLPWEDWQKLAERLRDRRVTFVIDPYIRFAGEVGEQATMFFRDPSGNALEFKAFKDLQQLFAK